MIRIMVWTKLFFILLKALAQKDMPVHILFWYLSFAESSSKSHIFSDLWESPIKTTTLAYFDSEDCFFDLRLKLIPNINFFVHFAYAFSWASVGIYEYNTGDGF